MLPEVLNRTIQAIFGEIPRNLELEKRELNYHCSDLVDHVLFPVDMAYLPAWTKGKVSAGSQLCKPGLPTTIISS